MRICTKCQEPKDESAFNRHKWCRECSNRYSREWFKKNRDRANEHHRRFLEKNPDYYRRPDIVEKQRKITKDYYQRNIEEYRAAHREYYRNNKPAYMAAIHRRRARRLLNGGTFTHQEFEALCVLYGNICLKCRKAAKLTPDHVIPLCKGGRNSIENLQPLCLTCNISKGQNSYDYRPKNAAK